MNAADVLADQYFLGEPGFNAEGQAAALLAHGEQGVAILADGTLLKVELMPLAPSAEGVQRAWLVPVSAEAGDTDD